MNLIIQKYKVFIILFFVILMTTCQTDLNQTNNTFDISLIDTNIDPADNFYAFVNNGWIQKYPLPDDESRYSSFDQLTKETQIKVNKIIQELAMGSFADGTIEQKISDFYLTGMDTVKIEAQGVSPIEPELERISNLTSKDEIITQIAHMHQYGIYSSFAFFVYLDSKDSETQIAQLRQGGLGIPDRDYYIKDDARSKKLRDAYVPHMTKMFELCGFEPDTAKKKATLIMEFETALAEASMTRLERRDPHKTYNIMTLDEMHERYPFIHWGAYFSTFGIDDPGKVNVSQPQFFDQLNESMITLPLETWKAYLEWNVINEMANYLNTAVVDQNFEFYGKAYTGKEKLKPRWRRVLRTTSGALGEPIGQKFVEKYFPPEAKERMDILVDNLKIALSQRIDELDWMSDETKSKAKDKLAVMTVKIGYPEKWQDYSGMNVANYSYAQNVMNANYWHRMDNISKLGKPMDPDKWFFPPQTVNAYYSPQMNEICFPAGILQPPFFYLDGDDAVNYGSIGAVIGHEMTHGFDDRGRLYDKDGNLENWWTEEDSKRFNERAQVLVDQFNKIVVLDSIHANGELTLGENIADLGGLNIAFTGFQNASKNKPQSNIDGFTPEQRFFMAWGRVWAQNIRDEEILRRTQEDSHSLGYLRINIPISNMPEFHEAFGVEQGDPLFRNEEEKAKIW